MNKDEIKNQILQKKGLAEKKNTDSDKKKYPSNQDADNGNNTEKIQHNKYILVTDTFACLGFAVQHLNKYPDDEVIIAWKNSKMEESDDQQDIEDLEKFEQMGEGIIDKIHLDDLMADRENYRDWEFVWDGNHNVEENELLRKENFNVSFGGEFCNMLENDREYGLEFAESCGLKSPESFEFSDVPSAIDFIEQNNEESIYVFKPNDTCENWLTYVPLATEPINANIELIKFMEAVDKNVGIKDGLILQKKVKGVEVNVEAFVMNGEMVFAHANFENKRTACEDTGEMSGCSWDVDFKLSMDSKLFQETVGKFAGKLRQMNYTGFADANVIVGDFQEVYFLEFCFRSGYNMAINFFYNLSDLTFLEFAKQLREGVYLPKCRDGFGATLTMFTEKYKTGLPIFYPESLKNNFYLFDGFIEDDNLYMVGIDHEICVITAHEYSIETALKDVVNNAEKVIFPNRYARWDVARHKDVPTGAKRRFEALDVQKMFDPS